MLVIPQHKKRKKRKQNPFYTLSNEQFDCSVTNYALAAQKLEVASKPVLHKFICDGPAFSPERPLLWDDI